MLIKQALKLVLCAGVIVIAAEQPALAYLDPGSGSMFLQVLLGGVAAVGVIAKLYWHRLLSFFGRGKERKES